jgi:hypothetical protein
MPPAKFKHARDDRSPATLRKAALARLKVRWELERDDDEEWNPEGEPVIEPMLRSVEGGLEFCIQALRAHDDDDAKAFLEVHDALSASDRKHLSVEAIAHAAGIGSLRLAEVTQTALFLYGNMQTQMMLAAGLPKIVATSIQQAKTKKGLADREWMLKAGKILPLPKGAQIAIQNNYPGERQEKEAPEIGGHVWKYPEDRLKEIVAVTTPKQLEASTSRGIDAIHFEQNRPVVFER